MPVPITPVVPTLRQYPSFAPGVDRTVIDAIRLLYDKVYQLSDQVQLLAAYLNKNP